MTTLKHIAGRAEVNGWSAALTDLVKAGKISVEVAVELADLSGQYVVAFAEGKPYEGQTLGSMEAKDIAFFNLLEASANATLQGFPNAD